MRQATIIISFCLCLHGVTQAEKVKQSSEKSEVTARLIAMQKKLEADIAEYGLPEVRFTYPYPGWPDPPVLVWPEGMSRETQSKPEIEVEIEQELLSTVTASFDVTSRAVTQAELQDDSSLEATDKVHEFIVTTDADIICIAIDDLETADGEIYQHPYGADTAEPPPAYIDAFPALGADSWVTTPGSSSGVLGGGFDTVSGDGDVVWFDLDNIGAVEDFLFARLTTEGGILEGRLALRGLDGPEFIPFSISFGSYSSLTPIPEPSTCLLAIIPLACAIGRRRSCRPC